MWRCHMCNTWQSFANWDSAWRLLPDRAIVVHIRAPLLLCFALFLPLFVTLSPGHCFAARRCITLVLVYTAHPWTPVDCLQVRIGYAIRAVWRRIESVWCYRLGRAPGA